VNNRPRQAPAGPAELGERALIQATRALAGVKDLDVSFGPALPGQSGAAVRLPPVKWPLTATDAARVRGHADHLALRNAYHDPVLHARYRPSGSRARDVYDAVEDMRCQSLGGNVLAGVAQNLTAALNEALGRKTSTAPYGARPAPMAQALALMVRERLTGSVSQLLTVSWRHTRSRVLSCVLAPAHGSCHRHHPEAASCGRSSVCSRCHPFAVTASPGDATRLTRCVVDGC